MDQSTVKRGEMPVKDSNQLCSKFKIETLFPSRMEIWREASYTHDLSELVAQPSDASFSLISYIARDVPSLFYGNSFSSHHGQLLPSFGEFTM